MTRGVNTMKTIFKPLVPGIVLISITLIMNGFTYTEPEQSNEKIVTEPTVISIDYKPFEIRTYDDMITYWCLMYEIDPNLAIAISRYETGHYTSKMFTEDHNFGGMRGSKGFMSFATDMEGCEAFVSMLKYGYIDEGLNTPELIQPKYCPGSTTWAIQVRRLMK